MNIPDLQKALNRMNKYFTIAFDPDTTPYNDWQFVKKALINKETELVDPDKKGNK